MFAKPITSLICLLTSTSVLAASVPPAAASAVDAMVALDNFFPTKVPFVINQRGTYAK